MTELLRRRIAQLLAAGGVGVATAIATLLIGGTGGSDTGLEGYSRKAYPDPATGGAPWTICYGHTGPDVKPGMVLSDADCKAILDADLVKVKAQVDPLIKVPATETQKAALYSFVYNVGVGNFRNSTLLQKLNVGNYPAACQELKRWTYANGKRLQGLINRRDIEKQVCEWQQQPIKSLVSAPSSGSQSR